MRYDDPNTPMSSVVGVIGAVLLVVIILLLEGLYFHMVRSEETRKLVEPTHQPLVNLEAAQQDLLSSYGWVDEETGVVRIPVEQAAEMMVAEHGAN